MVLPASVPVGTVIGRWWNTNGSDATGTIVFLARELIEVPDLPQGVVLPIRYPVDITAGVLNVSLPAGFYDVSVRLSELYRDTKVVEVVAGQTLNLPDAIGVVPEEELLTPVRSVNGIPPDSSGDIVVPGLAAVTSVNSKTGVVQLNGVDIPVDSSSWKVLTGSNVQAALNRSDTAALNARSTGVRYGGVLTVDGGIGVGSTVSITALAGGILDNTNANSPTYTVVEAGPWTAQTPLYPITYWYVDATGTLQQSNTVPTPEQYRTRIYLYLTSVNAGVVTGVVPANTPVQQTAVNLRDLASALGAIRLSGLSLASASTNLTFQVTSGKVYSYGIPGVATPTNPSNINLPTFNTNSGGTFRYGTNTVQINVDRTTLDPGNYQSGGSVTPIPGPGNTVGVHWVFVFPSVPNYRVAYGSAVYPDFTSARAAIGSLDPFNDAPASYRGNGYLVGAILATKNAVNLASSTHAQFLSTNKFGVFGGGVGVGGGGYLTESLIVAKGDLITGDAPGSATIRSVGSDGQVLTADSAQLSGLSWTTPAPELAGYDTTGKLTQTFGPGDTSGVWTVVGSAWQLTVPASVGDILVMNPSVIANVGSDAEMDVCSVVSGVPARYYSSGTATQAPNGHGGLYMGTSYNRRLAPVQWQVSALDIQAGTVTLAYMYRSGPGVTWGSAVYPNEISLTNLGSP